MRHGLGHVKPRVPEGTPCATWHAGQDERTPEGSGKRHDAEIPENPAWPGIRPAPSPARPGPLIPGIYLFGGICRKPHGQSGDQQANGEEAADALDRAWGAPVAAGSHAGPER